MLPWKGDTAAEAVGISGTACAAMPAGAQKRRPAVTPSAQVRVVLVLRYFGNVNPIREQRTQSLRGKSSTPYLHHSLMHLGSVRFFLLLYRIAAALAALLSVAAANNLLSIDFAF
jgi:hypothetical protein